VATLRAAGCVFAEDEAVILLEAAAEHDVASSAPAVGGSEQRLDELVARRVAGEPLEQIVGWVDFAGMRLQVRPGVFVPRQRTRMLAEHTATVTKQVADSRGSGAESGTGTVPRPVVLEAFCGVGPVASAVAASVPEAAIHVGDADEQAVRCAVANVEAYARAGESSANVTGHVLDCLHGLPDELRHGIDVIAAVPPYVPVTAVDFLPREALDFEPSTALFGGVDGLDLVRRLIAESLDWLAPEGALLIELGQDQVAEATGFATERELEAQSHLGEDEQTVVLELRPGHWN
jgi:release factor glutamine methyltransferase